MKNLIVKIEPMFTALNPTQDGRPQYPPPTSYHFFPCNLSKPKN